MRKISVFVLRLVIDSEQPHRLRGAIRLLSNDADYPFINGASLLNLLRQLSTDSSSIELDEKSHEQIQPPEI